MSDATQTPPKPAALDVQPETIPDALKEFDHWLVWRYEWRDGEWTKPPYEGSGKGYNINATAPDNGVSFETALETCQSEDYDGIGLITSPDLPVGLDIDHCRDDATPHGSIPKIVSEIVERWDSYMEISPSGTGIRGWAWGEKPEGRNKRKLPCDPVVDGETVDIEMYDGTGGRYLTITGHHINVTPADIRESDAIEWAFGEYLVDDEGPETGADRTSANDRGSLDLSDDKLLEKAHSASNGEKFARLHDRGDTTGYPSHSEARMAYANLLAFYTGPDPSRMLRLFQQSNLCRGDDDVRKFRDYEIPKALNGRTEYWSPTREQHTKSRVTDSGDGGERDGFDVAQAFIDGCQEYEINADMVKSQKTADGERVYTPVTELVKGRSIGDAIFQFAEQANVPSGTQKQAVVGHVVLAHFRECGEFFVTPRGILFHFNDIEKQVYRVDGEGQSTFSDEFAGLLSGRYRLLSGRFSRNLGKDIYITAKRNAPEREVYRFACFDQETGELYVSDFSNGYYAISPEGIEHRHNGEDVFFLPDGRAEGYEYHPPDERPELPDEIPGEIGTWRGKGDPIMRLLGNRVNYAEGASLGPSQQRKQLYIHIHALPFIDLLNARPIMAWVGEKGSGKTVIQRSIGRFIYGPDFTESTMPDSRDDFLAKVSNQALAFLDNYDEAEDWANDLFAAIATGAGVDKRELWTTNDLYQEVPRCWLSITSRDLPDRRDDVADRLLIFRADRLEDNVVGMGNYLRQIDAYRDVAWSAYLDNLRKVVATYQETNTESMSSTHRMADWAIMARVVADALDVSNLDELLEVMQTERAAFALENEDWAHVIGKWVRDDDNPEAGGYQPAKDIAAALNDYADANTIPLANLNAQGLGSRLNQWETELSELYGLDINHGSPKEYRFTKSDAGNDENLAGYQ